MNPMGKCGVLAVAVNLVLACGLLFVSAGVNAAVDFACHEEAGTRSTSCVDLNGIRANGDLRASQLYKGGPKTVLPTGYLFIADCKKRVAALQDSDGVNFGAGPYNATEISRQLYDYLCNAKKVRKHSKLTLY